MDAPRDPIEAQLVQHSRALLVLARSLLDEAGAEDLVQDACVAALQQRPDPRDGLGPWLSAVVRNLAARRRRSAARRRAREVTAIRPGQVRAPCDVAAETDLLRRIAGAVHALPEPFRTAVHLRYWQGLSPAAIAARLGVPHNTVRSRLQRGRAMVRGRLDDELGDRGAWTVTLGAALEFAKGAPTAGLRAALLQGALMMNAKWILGGAAALLAGLAYQIGSSPAPPAAAPDTSVRPAASAEPASVGRPRRPMHERVAAPSRPASDGETVTLRGRCVDGETHAPVAACLAAVRGLREEYFAWVEDESYEAPAPVRSDESGCFVLQCAPRDGRAELCVSSPGAAAMTMRWESLTAGAEIDVGDVEMRAGCLVTGSLADGDGVPRGGARIVLSSIAAQLGPEPEGIAPVAQVALTSARDGSWSTPWPLPAGEWSVGVTPPDYLAGNARLAIEPGQRRAELALRVLRELGSITGVIVDSRGAPVAGARVQPSPMGPGRAVFARSGDDGRFRLVRIEGKPDGPVRLEVDAEGFERLLSAGEHTWGGDDAYLVLQRPRHLDLQVVAASNSAPVTDFAIRLAPDPQVTRSFAQQDWRRRAEGHHPDGRVRVPLRRGRHVLLVEPEDGRWAPTGPLPLEMTETGLPPQLIELREVVQRRLRVVDSGHAPVPGVRAELIQLVIGQAITPRSAAETAAGVASVMMRDSGGLLLHEGVTDQSGEVNLSGPARNDLALRLSGAGLTAQVIEPVVLASGMAPLEVVVDRGAVVIGRVLPRDLTSRLQLPIALPSGAGAAPAPRFAGLLPQVWLERTAGARVRFPEGRGQGRVLAADGSFELDGVPPGDWQVRFRYTLLRPGQGSSIGFTTTLGRIDELRAGERREVELDAGRFVPGRLRAQVFLDGEPVSGPVQLHHRDGDSAIMPLTTSAGPDGRLEALLPPGRYAVSVVTERAGRRHQLLSAPSAVVLPAGESEHVFALASARVRVRVVDAAGAPVVGRKFSVSAERYRGAGGTTDEDGVLVLDPVPVAGSFSLVTWPDHLADGEAQTAYIRAHPYPEWMDVLLRAGPIDATSVAPDALVELRLR